MALVRDVRRHEPLSGHPFIFFSKRCDRVRIVYWGRHGYAMWTKRLEKGGFRPIFSSDQRLSSVAFEAVELALIVEGIDINFVENTDEYEQEVGTILPRLASCGTQADVRRVVYEEFARWFGVDTCGPESRYDEVATEIWAVWNRR
jgi:hypothetical protein